MSDLNFYRHTIKELHEASLMTPEREAQEKLGEVLNYIDGDLDLTLKEARERLKDVHEICKDNRRVLKVYELTLERIIDET